MRFSNDCPLLTRVNNRKMLEWVHQHANWNAGDWGRYLFSDESRVRLHSSDGRLKGRRNRGEFCIENNVTYHQPYVGSSIIVWVGMFAARRTELVPLGNAIMNSVK